MCGTKISPDQEKGKVGRSCKDSEQHKERNILVSRIAFSNSNWHFYLGTLKNTYNFEDRK